MNNQNNNEQAVEKAADNELDYFEDVRRSFSPCQMPSKAHFNRESLGCSRPSLFASNVQPEATLGARLLTDPIAQQKDNPGETRKQLWKKAKTKELTLGHSS